MTLTTESIMDNAMQNEWIVCVQCDTEFEYDVVEQARHAEMGYDMPRRCPDCRKHKTRILSGWERKMNKTRQKKNQRRDEEGKIVRISTNTYDEKEYIVDFDGYQDELVNHLTELVEVQGSIVLKIDRHPYVKVASYSLLTPLEDINVKSLIGKNNFPA